MSTPDFTATGQTQGSQGPLHRILIGVSVVTSGGAALVAAWLFVRLFARYSVDVPYYEDWVAASLLDRQDRGVLSWQDLWKSNNEHRVPVPLVVILVIGRLTRFNVRAQMGTSMLAIFASCGGAFYAARRLAVQLRVSAIPALGLVAAFLLSRAQWSNILWGWQITLTFGAAFGFATLLIIAPVGTATTVSWKRWTFALLAALLCQYSFASGLLIWPIGLGLIVLRAGDDKWKMAALWTSIGSASTYIYVQGLERAGGTSAVSVWKTIDYALTQLGGTFALRGWECAGGGTLRCRPIHDESMRAGAVGVVALVAVSIYLMRIRRFTESSGLIGWAVWATLSALLTGIGRASLGTEQALASRYVTLSSPLWATLSLLVPMLIQHRFQHRTQHRNRTGLSLQTSQRRASIALGVATTLTTLATVLLVSRTGNVEFAAYGSESRLLVARGALRSSAPTDDQLRTLFIDVSEIRRLLPTMERQKISVFREPRR